MIEKVGEIFRQHSMTESYAPLYVHRHYRMLEKSIRVMFYETPAEHIDVAKLTPVQWTKCMNFVQVDEERRISGFRICGHHCTYIHHSGQGMV
jgi:hypothetical protein